MLILTHNHRFASETLWQNRPKDSVVFNLHLHTCRLNVGTRLDIPACALPIVSSAVGLSAVGDFAGLLMGACSPKGLL